MDYYKVENIISELETSKNGLSSSQVDERLNKFGPNIIESKKKISAIKIFLQQFSSPIIWILIVAIIVSAFLKEYTDAIVILIIVILNSIMGFFQEFKAEKAIEALKKLASLKATVIRNGKEIRIEATNLVPGDLIVLDTGDKVPADARIIESISLETQEGSLTGESVPVVKNTNVIKKTVGIGDRSNMIFSGTIITKGRGKAIVCGTGISTELGKIATLIESTKKILTPLQKELAKLSKLLGSAVILISIIVFAAGIFKGNPAELMFLTAVSLAVAAIPEGLPAVVTMSLALGVQRMLKRNALVRKLPSVETLGSTSVICTDKTGTLTKNEMTVKRIFVDNQIITVTGTGYHPKGEFSSFTKSLNKLLEIGLICNNAKINDNEVIGDPTEAALLVSAQKANIKTNLERIMEIPFSSERKRMTLIVKEKDKQIALTKGAPDIILEHCTKILIDGKVKELTKKDKDLVLGMNERFAKDALRVLGFSYKETNSTKEEDVDKDMVFVGLQGMIDPPREDVKGAIEQCNKAGIRVIMITGDHVTTAEAIAAELGIKGASISGSEIDKINLDEEIKETSIFARVNPEHKMKIISALRKQGHIVAMTGDGVNDAPALKNADIGIAMGITGTDVAKEASDIVLMDDKFTSIVSAIEEGRAIFDNIKKFVFYLLSSNIGEVFTVFIAMMIGMPLPLLAIQILWINLLTDGLPALALGIEPAEKNIMLRKPRKSTDHIISRKGYLVSIGVIMMIGTLFVFNQYSKISLEYGQTMAFCTLMMFQLFNVINVRQEKESSLLPKNLFVNKWLWMAIGSSILFQMIVIYIPRISQAFSTVPIKGIDWIYILIVSSSILIVGEIYKRLK